VNRLALSWLLWRSPVILPISVTSKTTHLEENFAAASLKLDEEKLAALSG
jgi:aryl-alcohol dehydrogenase-like predicted oxidoreductase